MRVWIDARRGDPRLAVFGQSPLERQLRSLAAARGGGRARGHPGRRDSGAAPRSRGSERETPEEIHIELAPGAPIPALPPSLERHLAPCWSQSGQSSWDCLERLLREPGGGPLLALSADTVVDPRLVAHLLRERGDIAFLGPEGGAVLRLEGAPPGAGDTSWDLAGVARACLERGAAKAFDPGSFDGYLPLLRRSLPPHLFVVGDAASAQRVERFLFEANYKGSTDFLTRHVYPPLVWRLLRPLARARIHPNWVTLLSIVATLAAIPLFAAGEWVSGLLLAFGMSVLDSVDGKLARVTFTSSALGNVLDHGTDLVHPPLWYCAWAWGLCGGDTQTAVFQASLGMAVLYAADRLLELVFRLRTGRPLQSYRPLDVRLRTFASRRNVNLAIFTCALPLGLGVPAIGAIVALQAATALYHLVRLIQFWSPAARPACPSAAPLPSLPGGPGAT